MRILYLQIIIGIALFTVTALTHASAMINSLGADGRYLLTPANFEYLETEPTTSWEEILSDDYQTQWKSTSISTLNVWMPDKTIWVRIPIANHHLNSQLTLEIRWPLLQNIEMRQFDGVELSAPILAGQHFPSDVVTQLDKNLVFPFELSSSDKSYLYLKINDENLIFIPMVLWESERYAEYSDKRLIFFSAAFGILLVMTIYNLSLSVFTRDEMYFFYSLSVIGTILYSLASTGYGNLYLWRDNLWMIQNAYPIFTPLLFLTVTYFFRVFMNLDFYGGWLVRTNNFFLILWGFILISAFTPLQNLGLMLTIPSGIILTIFGICVAIYLWAKGNPSAKFFVLAWSSIIFTTFLTLVMLIGVVNYFEWFEFTQTLSFLFEVVLLSVALAERISREREEKEFAQAEVIDQKSSILIIQEKANIELEKNVRSRTLELAKALTELERANEELARVSTIDPLTQLYNRGYFDEAANAEISRASRTQASVSMILIDIDHFKKINDSYGHLVGDKCLKLVAKSITDVVSRSSDVVARYGGEEFAVILPDTIERNALIVAERIRNTIEDIAFINEGKAIKLTASFGVVGRTIVQGDTVEEFIRSADSALYQAKDNGRNRIEVNVLAVKTNSAIRNSPDFLQ